MEWNECRVPLSVQCVVHFARNYQLSSPKSIYEGGEEQKERKFVRSEPSVNVDRREVLQFGNNEMVRGMHD
jgi:hypothetical protein